MAQVTDPIILDSTGQAIKNSIDLLTANINRTASNIPYDSNLTIKGKIDEIDAKTASDIPYSSGVSVKQKIDSIVTEQEGAISATKIGKGVILSLYFGGLTLSSDGKTFEELIPVGFRPSGVVNVISKTYNGSNYIDCMINLGNDGTISITGIWGEAITGIQPQYTKNSYICYRV